jgi:hypothetical protein
MGEPAQRVYYWKLTRRILACFVCSVLAVFGVALSVGVITDPIGRSAAGLLLPLGVLAVFDVFWILTAISAVRAGRLVLDGERALLPRPPIAGLELLLGPRQLDYSRVERYGIGISKVPREVAKPTLLFQLRADGHGHRAETLWLCLVWYAEPAAILQQMMAGIGYAPELLTNNWIGMVRFRPTGSSPTAASSSEGR